MQITSSNCAILTASKGNWKSTIDMCVEFYYNKEIAKIPLLKIQFQSFNALNLLIIYVCPSS